MTAKWPSQLTCKCGYKARTNDQFHAHKRQERLDALPDGVFWDLGLRRMFVL